MEDVFVAFFLVARGALRLLTSFTDDFFTVFTLLEVERDLVADSASEVIEGCVKFLGDVRVKILLLGGVYKLLEIFVRNVQETSSLGADRMVLIHKNIILIKKFNN